MNLLCHLLLVAAALNMPERSEVRISCVQGDITKQSGIAVIVNAANEKCLGGGGIDGAIHHAAGSDLKKYIIKVIAVKNGVRCPTSHAVITPSFNLSRVGITHIIHTVGPLGSSAHRAELLRNAYLNSLRIAHQNGLRTIAFPAISTGIYEYPFEEAKKIAIEAVQYYLREYPDSFDEIRFVLFSQKDFDSYQAELC